MRSITLDGESLNISTTVAVADAWSRPEAIHIELSAKARDRMKASRAVVERLVDDGRIVYGITTGFGAFKDRVIAPSETAELQRNLLMSHSVGVGPALPENTVRAMMLVRANALAKGHSGIRLETVEALLELLNRGVHPVVPAQGSVGSSGDLAPLAHMALVLIGLGEAVYGGQRMSGAEALRLAGLAPLSLQAKEGVALLNGTSLMTAIGCQALDRAGRLLQGADVAAAMSLEALKGTVLAFDARLHAARPHPGQVACAGHLRGLLDGSELIREASSTDVQDPYTLRCIPQVHGAVRDAVAQAGRVLLVELNSATDNPLIFVDGPEGVALSGGNFHGEPVALVMDYMAVALTDLGNMTERRIARLLDTASNGGVLPPFLTRHGGLHSGLMMLQYTAAALASENKVLAHPASADSIPTSANTEDHVSMGTIAARKALLVMEHVETIVALELLCAAQGVDFRRQDNPGLHLGKGTEPAYQAIRQRVPFIEADTVMYPHIETLRNLVRGGLLTRAPVSGK
jgi:histidine ammonia-lyase